MNQKIITRIAKEFNLPRETIAKMVSFYEEIKKDIKEQYLAHLVRTLENRMRRLTKNDFSKSTNLLVLCIWGVHLLARLMQALLVSFLLCPKVFLVS